MAGIYIVHACMCVGTCQLYGWKQHAECATHAVHMLVFIYKTIICMHGLSFRPHLCSRELIQDTHNALARCLYALTVSLNEQNDRQVPNFCSIKLTVNSYQHL